jgi:hypothetical protein
MLTCKLMSVLRAPQVAVPLALVLASACATPEDETSADPNATALDREFAGAGEEFGVPTDLLKAIAYVETRWEMVVGEAEHDGVEPAFGIMALRGDRLDRGAALAAVDVDAAAGDRVENIRAAAALLADLAAEHAIDVADLAAWGPVVAEMSGIIDTDAQAEYVQAVYAVLREGVGPTPDSQPLATIAGIDIEPDFPDREVPLAAAAVDFPGAVWRPSPNYNSRGGHAVHAIVIHTCEGNYSGCWSWLRNSAAGASAHYVVNESGSEVTQLVRESNRAWHVAASYDCSRVSGHDCGKNGKSVNTFSVGIEHGGFASQKSFPAGQIDTSARLTCDISKGHNIPRDRLHVLSHGQLQPWNRTDPGKNWPWSTYMSKVNAHCGGGGGGGGSSFIVDSNNARNDLSKAKMEVSGTWAASNLTGGYHGTGYYFAGTKAVSDPATFWFHMPAAGKKTIDAWWTAGANRSAGAPFVAFNAAGTKLGTKYVDQRGNGSKWVALGTWNFSAGWNKVVLSRWAADGSVVIADAIRVR